MQDAQFKIGAFATACVMTAFIIVGYIGENRKEAEERYARCLQMQDSVKHAEYTYTYAGRKAVGLIESPDGIRFLVCSCDYEKIDATFDTITPVSDSYIDVTKCNGVTSKIHYVR